MSEVLSSSSINTTTKPKRIMKEVLGNNLVDGNAGTESAEINDLPNIDNYMKEVL